MKPIARVAILMFATLFCGQLFAQSLNGKFVLLPGVPVAVALNAPVVTGETNASSDDDAGLYTIFSNFGKKPNCYNQQEGWTVAGKHSPLGFSQYIAMIFTPQADATVTELKLALFGQLGAVISLNEDSDGLPGKPIHTWVTSKLGNSGKPPCVYTAVKSKQGLPVQKGTQYWVVAAARGTEWDVWNFTYKGSTGDFAYDYDDEGWKIENSYLSAFAVLGTR